MSEAASAPLLAVRDLSVKFATEGGVVQALSGVSFDVPRGKVVGLMGESGCGKSVTALSIVRLLPEPAGRITSGSVVFDGTDLLGLRERALESVRGKQIGFVFQDPLASLNPVYRVGAQIAEAIRLHERVSRGQARARVIDDISRNGLKVTSFEGIERHRPRFFAISRQFGGNCDSIRLHSELLCERTSMPLYRRLPAHA